MVVIKRTHRLLLVIVLGACVVAATIWAGTWWRRMSRLKNEWWLWKGYVVHFTADQATEYWSVKEREWAPLLRRMSPEERAYPYAVFGWKYFHEQRHAQAFDMFRKYEQVTGDLYPYMLPYLAGHAGKKGWLVERLKFGSVTEREARFIRAELAWCDEDYRGVVGLLTEEGGPPGEDLYPDVFWYRYVDADALAAMGQDEEALRILSHLVTPRRPMPDPNLVMPATLKAACIAAKAGRYEQAATWARWVLARAGPGGAGCIEPSWDSYREQASQLLAQ